MNLGLPVAGVGKVVGALVRGVGAEELAGGGDEGLEVSRRAQVLARIFENEGAPRSMKSRRFSANIFA